MRFQSFSVAALLLAANLFAACGPQIVCGNGTEKVDDACVAGYAKVTCDKQDTTLAADGQCHSNAEHCGDGTYYDNATGSCLPLPANVKTVTFVCPDGTTNDVGSSTCTKQYVCTDGVTMADDPAQCPHVCHDGYALDEATGECELACPMGETEAVTGPGTFVCQTLPPNDCHVDADCSTGEQCSTIGRCELACPMGETLAADGNSCITPAVCPVGFKDNGRGACTEIDSSISVAVVGPSTTTDVQPPATLYAAGSFAFTAMGEPFIVTHVGLTWYELDSDTATHEDPPPNWVTQHGMEYVGLSGDQLNVWNEGWPNPDFTFDGVEIYIPEGETRILNTYLETDQATLCPAYDRTASVGIALIKDKTEAVGLWTGKVVRFSAKSFDLEFGDALAVCGTTH